MPASPRYLRLLILSVIGVTGCQLSSRDRDWGPKYSSEAPSTVQIPATSDPVVENFGPESPSAADPQAPVPSEPQLAQETSPVSPVPPPAEEPTESAPWASETTVTPTAPPVPEQAPAPQSDPQLAAVQKLESLGAKLKRDGSGQVVSVDLGDTAVTDEDLVQLFQFPQLKIVSLRRTRISDSGLRSLGLINELELLILGGTAISDVGLEELWTLQHLRFLALDDTQVTDAAWTRIAGIKSLEGVSVMRTLMTAAGKEQFQAAHPGCRVIAEEEPVSAPAPPVAPQPPALPEITTSQSRRSPKTSEAHTALHVQPASLSPLGSQQEFRSLLGARLRDPELLLALGAQLSSQGRHDEAAGILATALLYAPQDERIEYQLGLSLAYSGRMDMAYLHLQRVVGTGAAYHDLGVICLERREPFQAEAYFSRAIDADPQLLESHRWLTMLRSQPVDPAAMPIAPYSEQQLLTLLNSSLNSPVLNSATTNGYMGVTIIPAGGRAP